MKCMHFYDKILYNWAATDFPKAIKKRENGSERPIVIYNAVDTTRKSIKDVF